MAEYESGKTGLYFGLESEFGLEYHKSRTAPYTEKPSLEVAPTTLVQKTRQATKKYATT